VILERIARGDFSRRSTPARRTSFSKYSASHHPGGIRP
jgi:hypothetical protein